MGKSMRESDQDVNLVPYGRQGRQLLRNMSRNQAKGLISTILSHLKRKKLKKEQIKQEIVGTDFHGNRYILKHAGITAALRCH
jgi:hypothetical protein